MNKVKTIEINNSIFILLEKLGVVDRQSIEIVQSFVRDDSNISVYKCNKSGVLFLNTSNHIELNYYNDKSPTHLYGTKKREMIKSNNDSLRRFSDFSNVIRGKKWVDVGSGSGAMLDLFGPIAKKYIGIEPQKIARESLKKLGHDVRESVKEIHSESFDIVTLFHVFEHIGDPLSILREIKEVMKPGGRLIIEVPNADDFLLKFISSDSFKSHTFWSEHLILHTRQTITALLEYAGFNVVAVSGIQRYSLANTLYWLANNKPNGHIEWNFLSNNDLDSSWESTLAKLNLTDTLIIEAMS
jgi:2-polyprenyl-3-methyl-5-hydroxy-6-metoxy-1,4-benzoquinol methylase